MSPTLLAALSVIGSPPSNCVLFQFSFDSESISFAICSIDASERVTDSSKGRGTYIPGSPAASKMFREVVDMFLPDKDA